MSEIRKAYFNIVIGLLTCLLSSGYVYWTRTQNEHEVSNSVEFTKKLDDYYFYKNKKGKGAIYFSTVMVFEDGSKVWTDVLDKNSADDVLRESNKNIIFYANLASTAERKDGAIKCWGLWVDGKEISTPKSDLDTENGALLILLGFGLFTGLVLIIGGLAKRSGQNPCSATRE